MTIELTSVKYTLVLSRASTIHINFYDAGSPDKNGLGGYMFLKHIVFAFIIVSQTYTTSNFCNNILNNYLLIV